MYAKNSRKKKLTIALNILYAKNEKNVSCLPFKNN